MLVEEALVIVQVFGFGQNFQIVVAYKVLFVIHIA